METATAQELAQHLAAAHEKLNALVAHLRAIDGELSDLAVERKRHALLQDVCNALDQLASHGGAELFWGMDVAAHDVEARLDAVYKRLAVFNDRVAEIEARRRAQLDEINREQEHAQFLEDDVYDALEEEERRKHEWIVEREIDSLREFAAMPSWTLGGEDDRRFRKSLAGALLASLAIAVIVPFIELPLSEPDAAADVPERLVTMMMQEIPRPKPPTQVPVPPPQVAEQKPVEKVEPQQVVQPAPQEPIPEVPAPQGILAFREKLDAFKDAPIVSRLGSQAQINNSNASARPERSMLTNNGPGSSGGIQLAALSRNLGAGGDERGAAIQGDAVTVASSTIAATGGSDRPVSDGAILARTDEEIQIVFDRYKASLYRLYNRELRNDPTLQGKMILRLTIEPDGSVSACALHATDMEAPELVTQIVERVRTFDFGAKEVPAITIVYPIDFLPAT